MKLYDISYINDFDNYINEYDSYDYSGVDDFKIEKNELDYGYKNIDKFYCNIELLKNIIADSKLKNILKNKDAYIRGLDVFIDLDTNDIIGSFNSLILKDVFDQENKYNISISLLLRYKDYDYSKIYEISLIVKNPFETFRYNKDNYEYGYFMNENKIDFIYKRQRILRKNKEYYSNEANLILYFINNLRLSKDVLSMFRIEDIIENKDIFELFKIYVL